jgi:hypothetical protein
MPIFESPDNGQTIYVRDANGTKRTLVRASEKHERLNQWIVWQDILIASETNPELKEALNKAQVIYEMYRK